MLERKTAADRRVVLWSSGLWVGAGLEGINVHWLDSWGLHSGWLSLALVGAGVALAASVLIPERHRKRKGGR